MMMFNKIRVRRSQLLSPFGVGAILDLPEEALMLMGLEQWETGPNTQIRDDRLAARLKIECFHEPIRARQDVEYGPKDTDGGSAHFTRFPLWHYCPRCREMDQASPTSKAPPRCSGQAKSCKTGKGRYMVPVRFSIACSNGHIDDFPWLKWAHIGGSICENPKLALIQSSGAGLGGLKVICRNSSCSEFGATLSTVYRGDQLKDSGCSGHRPWLGPRNQVAESCDQEPVLIQRGASNAYFARLVTSILIPPFSKRLFRILDGAEFEANVKLAGLEDGKIPMRVFEHTAEKHRVSTKDLLAAYSSRLQQVELLQSEEVTEEKFRFDEYEAFKGKDLGDTQDELRLNKVRLDECSQGFRETVDKVILVEKLVETRALTGFSRLDPNARSSSLSFSRQNWLPAISGSGEGIFVELNRARLASWAAQSEVQARVKMIERRSLNYELATRRSGHQITASFVLIHTLAHILNRRLSFDCGYGSSSIRERIYSCEDYGMAGLLIYTSEAGNEGTLGGLVVMGEPLTFESLLREALFDSAQCSNDPLCEESTGQGPGSVNLAACQGCCLTPETSCEEGNFFLDRQLVIGTVDNPELGFFSTLLS